MTATADRLRGRIRWSAAVRCPRWAAMGLLGYEPAEPTDYMRRVWRRGKQLGDYMAERFETEHGIENVIREKAVPWPATGMPLGELHTDIFLTQHRRAIEVKSSHSPNSLIDDALRQLAGEIHFDPEAHDGALALIDPIDLGEEILPFVLTPDAVEEVEALAAMIADAGKTGTLPPCVCATPGACRGKWCPYTEQAWEDWEPPAARSIDGEAAVLVTEAWQALRLKQEHTADADAANLVFKEIMGRLLELGVEPGREYLTGPLRVLGSSVKGRKTFSLSRAEKLGIWTGADDARLGEFVKIGEGHVRWSITKVGEQPLVVATDEEAPF